MLYCSAKTMMLKLLRLCCAAVCAMATANCVDGDDRMRWLHSQDNAKNLISIVHLLKNTEAVLGDTDPQSKVPLQQILMDQRVPFIIDERALEEESVSFDEKVLPPLAGQSLYGYLDFVLKDLNLIWRPVEGGVQITTRKSDSNLVCVYNITDLVQPEDRKESKDPKGSVAAARLLYAITVTINPDEWNMNGGLGAIEMVRVNEETIAIIYASAESQIAILELIHQIRRAANLPDGFHAMNHSQSDRAGDSANAKSRRRSVGNQRTSDNGSREVSPSERGRVAHRGSVRSTNLKRASTRAGAEQLPLGMSP